VTIRTDWFLVMRSTQLQMVIGMIFQPSSTLHIINHCG